jgi:hypothetical protein
MEYKPNFNDPRVIKRIKHAYGFARGILSTTTAHGWSTRYIDKYFGQQQNQLSKWLRNQLLVVVCDRFNKDTGQTKTYLFNTEGADALRATLYESEPIKVPEPITIYDEKMVRNWIQREFGRELADKDFTYDDKSSRLWHPLQSVRRQYKQQALNESGLKYHYDIQCSAPTLILQHAQRQHVPMDLYLNALNTYLKNRQTIRADISTKAELDPKTVKVLINALFCGARLGANNQLAMFQLLEQDRAKMAYIKQDPFIIELREDIKTCWEYISPSMTRERNNKTNKLKPISSSQKWNRYFDLERQVLNSVIQYMKDNSIKYFLEHDGWSCDRVIDRDQLSDYVYGSTGYRVMFEVDY